MKTNRKELQRICEETDKVFKAVKAPGQLLEKVEEWTHMDWNIISYNIFRGKCLTIVLFNKKTKSYFLMHFYPGNQLDKWYIQIELDGVSQEEFVKHLIKNQR